MIKAAMPPASAIQTTASKSFLFMVSLTGIPGYLFSPDSAGTSVTAITFRTLRP